MPKTLLLIEDDPAIADPLQLALTREGWEVVWQSTSSQKAQQKAQSAGHRLLWEDASLWLGMTDLRGLAELPTLTAAGRRYRLDYADRESPNDDQRLAVAKHPT